MFYQDFGGRKSPSKGVPSVKQDLPAANIVGRWLAAAENKRYGITKRREINLHKWELKGSARPLSSLNKDVFSRDSSLRSRMTTRENVAVKDLGRDFLRYYCT